MTAKMRTAVLVVHGMGSQRPLDTVRGVVDAVWFDGTENQKNGRQVWTHPEPSGVDIDLTVMTTSHIKTASNGESSDAYRSADFHELYWAHLMSETRAVAVLLWLFELGRKGPRFSTAMNALWVAGAIFLCLLILSVTLIALKVITWFCSILDNPQWLLFTPLIMLFIGTLMGFAAAALSGAVRLAIWLAVFTLLIVAVFLAIDLGPAIGFPHSTVLSKPLWWANVLLPLFLSTAIVLVLMGKWGLLAHAGAYGLSWIFLVIYLYLPDEIRAEDIFAKLISDSRLPWSLASAASTIAAWVFVGVYLAAYVAFLQPFLGDAARYFRNSSANVAVRREIRKQAVDTLDLLHRLRIYDRIIVVAHSLGTVVAYDMLRAYYSRICDQLSLEKISDLPDFEKVNNGTVSKTELRSMGRAIIREMAKKIGPSDVRIDAGKPPEAWLVTDFVTLGSPLTHARYLMCLGRNTAELKDDFARRVKERDFPTCPPVKAESDGWLTFKNPRTGRVTLHHGGLFALSRWTNIYFPISQVFWGDAIGGPVRLQEDDTSLFGSYVEDKQVWVKKEGRTAFFSHTKYWDIKNGRNAPHIQALRAAINLEDS